MPPIRFYNSLTHQLEDFQPIEPGVVRMYNCGPTVYDYAHIGNFRAFVFADVLRRFLELSGYRVEQVMNLTDVGHMTQDNLADGGGEDKMQVGAEKLKAAKKQGKADVANPDDPYAVAQFFIDAFLDDAKALRVKVADEYPDQMPRATDHVVKSMVPMIQTLVDSDHAYVVEGADGRNTVYFSVESFRGYGKLSGNTLDKLKGGAGGRVADEHQQSKRHPADFLLWKADPSHLMKWDSPWGTGYPGWHIECSAMAKAVLGTDHIDIHTGGEDNIFPHHECEIAQSCGASGKDRFANYWLHTRFLLVDGEKMSKSKGNFYTVRDLLDGTVTGKPIDPAVVRYELFKAHYRSNMNFTLKGLEDSASAIMKLRDMYQKHNGVLLNKGCHPNLDLLDNPDVAIEYSEFIDSQEVHSFVAALGDDLNVSAALSIVFSWLRQGHQPSQQSIETMALFNYVLQVLPTEFDQGWLMPDDFKSSTTVNTHVTTPNRSVVQKCQDLDAARASKDFDTADRIRAELQDAGYEVKTTKEGTVATKKLA